MSPSFFGLTGPLEVMNRVTRKVYLTFRREVWAGNFVLEIHLLKILDNGGGSVYRETIKLEDKRT